MKLLALDTATQQCSVAVKNGEQVFHRSKMGVAHHNRCIFEMCDELLRESGLEKGDFDAVVYGRGPGMFTGIRVALSLAQSLSFAWKIPLVPVSDLAAMAQQLIFRHQAERAFVALDARMGEVYSGYFSCGTEDGLVVPDSPESVSIPEDVLDLRNFEGPVGGSGFREYPALVRCLRNDVVPDMQLLPHAKTMLALAVRDVLAGNTRLPGDAVPVYLRNQVVRPRSFAKQQQKTE